MGPQLSQLVNALQGTAPAGGAGGGGKVCVNDKKREYEKHRLSQEWK